MGEISSASAVAPAASAAASKASMPSSAAGAGDVNRARFGGAWRHPAKLTAGESPGGPGCWMSAGEVFMVNHYQLG